MTDKKTKKIATLTCPHCSAEQSVDVPTDRCLAFHQCEQCDETIEVPKESSNCCVVCEYADQKCPTATTDDDDTCSC
ncbi:MAG: GDCCVxC domain-containing (seleno)protein [Candidatus Paceibacterota bacterium]